MINNLHSLIPDFHLDPQAQGDCPYQKILIEDSNQCSGEWVTCSVLEHFLRSAQQSDIDPSYPFDLRVVFVAGQQSLCHY